MRLRIWRWALMGLMVWLTFGTARSAPARPPAPDPVKLFDLSVALEWEPGGGDSLRNDLALAGCATQPGDPTPQDRYLDDLRLGMRAFSAYLYQATEGRMALRTVTVSTGGRNWDSADIRILASVTPQPMAFIGGIVDAPTSFSPRPGLSYMAYPQGIILGRLWDGHGARCGAWSGAAAWRTLGHEWAHHALYLWDEYFDFYTQAEQYCSSTGLIPPARVGGAATNPLADSLMAYQYEANKLWLKSAPMPAGCAATPQWVVNQATDWQTVARFHPSVTAPESTAPGPDFASSSAAALFAFNVEPPPVAIADSSAPLRLDYPSVASVSSEGYLIEDRPGLAGPLRIVGQGELVPGQPHAFWGAQPGSRAALDLQNWRTGERRADPASYIAPTPLNPAQLTIITPTDTTWRPAMTITPILSSNQQPGAYEVAGLRVKLKECTFSAQQIIELGYCPAGGNCGALQTVTIGPDNSFEHTFSFPIDGQITPPAARGYIYARNQATHEEALSWYQLAGGVGPAHTIGHAPLLDGAVTVSLPAGGSLPPSADTQVLYGNAQMCAAAPPFIPSPILGLVGSPLTIQPVRSDRGGAGWDSADPPLAIRLSYDQALLDRLNIGEERLVVLRLNGSKWDAVAETGRSQALDWIAIQPQEFAGEGQVYAFGYRAQRTALPLVGR